jgi:hypothetical protein
VAGNPIQSVGGTSIPTPSSYTWDLADLSAEGSGWTEAVVLNKDRIGQIRKIHLTWNYPTIEQAAVILTAFNPNYITVTYLDGMTGGYLTSEFTVGDRSGVLYNTTLNKWESIAFNIIERRGR